MWVTDPDVVNRKQMERESLERENLLYLGKVHIKTLERITEEDLAYAIEDFESNMVGRVWAEVKSATHPLYSMKVGAYQELHDTQYIFGRIDPPIQNEIQNLPMPGSK